MNYESKYLKYKAKYLFLKKQNAGRLSRLAVKNIDVNGVNRTLPDNCFNTGLVVNSSLAQQCNTENIPFTNNNKYFIGLCLEHDANQQNAYDTLPIDLLRSTQIKKDNIHLIAKKNILANNLSRPTYITNSDLVTSQHLQTIITSINTDILNNQTQYPAEDSYKNNTVIIHISSHGSLYGNMFFSMNGTTGSDYTTVANFINLIRPLLTNSNIKNLIIITDFCYSGIRFKNHLRHFYETNPGGVKNVSFITMRPFIKELVVLSAFLESNPANVGIWTNVKAFTGPNYNSLKTNVSTKYGINEPTLTDIITQLNHITDHEMQILINQQLSKPFNNNLLDDEVLSNIIMSLFEEMYYLNTFNRVISKLLQNEADFTSLNLKNTNDLTRDINQIIKNEYLDPASPNGLAGWESLNIPDISIADFTGRYNAVSDIITQNVVDILNRLLISGINNAHFVHNYNNNNDNLNSQLMSDIF